MKCFINFILIVLFAIVSNSCSSEDVFQENKALKLEQLLSTKINEYGLKNAAINYDYLRSNINNISEEDIEKELLKVSNIRGRYILYKDSNGFIRSRKIDCTTRSSYSGGIFEVYSGSFTHGFFVPDSITSDYITISIEYNWSAYSKSSVQASISSDAYAECSIENFDYVFSGIAPSFTCSGDIKVKNSLAAYSFSFVGDYTASSNIGSITII